VASFHQGGDFVAFAMYSLATQEMNVLPPHMVGSLTGSLLQGLAALTFVDKIMSRGKNESRA